LARRRITIRRKRAVTTTVLARRWKCRRRRRSKRVTTTALARRWKLRRRIRRRSRRRNWGELIIGMARRWGNRGSRGSIGRSKNILARYRNAN
jgi:hypothetical protein